jgi:hypothetical protein
MYTKKNEQHGQDPQTTATGQAGMSHEWWDHSPLEDAEKENFNLMFIHNRPFYTLFLNIYIYIYIYIKQQNNKSETWPEWPTR